MGFSSVVQLWEEWQLRILVLGSLAIQCFLAVFAGARKSPVRPLYRFLIWLSYLGSDALAIYALATLFNRQSKVQQSSKYPSRDLEVLWTPILLMHLGGLVTISAYNIEDNELWRRHIVTAISQVRHQYSISDTISKSIILWLLWCTTNHVTMSRFIDPFCLFFLLLKIKIYISYYRLGGNMR
jgi:hypothetical protein